MARNRRRIPRQPVGWDARYIVDERAEDGWYECRVLNVSLGGAAMELFGPAPVLHSGLRVELQLANDSRAGLQLHGQMRNLRPSNTSGIQVGVEWRDLSPLEQEVLALLIEGFPAAAY